MSQELFDRAVSGIAASPLVATDHVQVTRRLLEFALANGMTLHQCCDPRFMDRSLHTLKKYARRFGMAFPDYVPRKLKPRKPRKPRVRKKKVE